MLTENAIAGYAYQESLTGEKAKEAVIKITGKVNGNEEIKDYGVNYRNKKWK